MGTKGLPYINYGSHLIAKMEHIGSMYSFLTIIFAILLCLCHSRMIYMLN